MTLIILGTFLRGPNWNFFGPYEYWDAHKVEVLNNVDLSQYFWIDLLGRGLPKAPQGSSAVDGDRLHPGARSAGHHCGAGCTSSLLPPLLAVTGVPQVLREDGLLALHADDELAAVHVVAADQDGAAVDGELEVHHFDSGILFELLVVPKARQALEKVPDTFF